MSFRLLKYHKIKEDQAFDNSTIAEIIQELALLFDKTIDSEQTSLEIFQKTITLK